jgi:PAS domain S-box-containing protein
MAEPLLSDFSLGADPQMYELLVSQLTDYVVFLTDPTGRIVSWNPGVEHILGYSKADWLGQPLEIIFTPDDRRAKKPEQEMSKAARDGRAPDIRWHQKKDESLLFAEGTMVALKDAGGKLLGFSKVMRDITERKRAEEALLESEERYRTLFNSIDQGFCIFEMKIEPSQRLDYRFIEVNKAFEEHSTLVNAEGKWMRELRPGHEEHWFEIYRDVALTGEPIRFQQRGQELDDRWFDLYAFRVGLPEQKRVGVLFTDITERKRFEEALRQSEERLQQLFAQAPVGVAVMRGRELVYELANPSYQEFLPKRQFLGRPIREVIPELDANTIDILNRVLDTGESFTAHEFYTPLDRDGDGVPEDVWFTFLYHPMRESDGTVSGIVVVGVDVTDNVLARQELERVNRGLEEFAYVASHDLKEPLRMVHSYSQLLVRRLGSEATAEQQKSADFIQQGVKRMEQLIQDLLSYSQTIYTVGESVTEASLEEALNNALSIVQARVEETGAAITHEPLPTVRGELVQLSHVFQNILSNALKYQPPGQPPEIHIAAQRQGGDCIISVRDNGIGFDLKQAERIFGLFKRLHHDDEYPGTGLGLAICRRIIERYGGKMWAEGESGKGSTFFFSLPAGG